ncbi:hypothetical protein [Bradyrhizobium sp.]|jgi:hypothetical protein|uniref:hypothetical protein n=1 Tax=Bradyrhizobium sp. TaxID=376 RepID=UPI0025BF17AA|nr:hypothetical protein [Bradyrhizobium sp.]
MPAQFPRFQPEAGTPDRLPEMGYSNAGTASKDGKTIRGSYQAYVDGVGKFVMTKQ